MIHPAWRFCLFLLVPLLTGCVVGATNGFKNEDVLAVRVGMSEADVLHVVGPPTRKVHSTGDNLDSWTWVDAGMVRTRVATIVFSQGVVVQVPNRESRSAADLSKQNAEKAVELNKIRSVERQKQDDTEADTLAAAVEKRRSDYIESHPGLSESTRNAVKKGLVQVGLLPEEIEASWGPPSRKNISDGAYGRREQWVYGDSTYVYFDDGKVTSWSISR
jgi:hypothetical protein